MGVPLSQELSPGGEAKLLKRRVCTGGQGQRGRQSGLGWGWLVPGPLGRGAGIFVMAFL